jgi:hypothetical protein
MKSILFLLWVVSLLLFFYFGVWCEPTLENIQQTIFNGVMYVLFYNEWKNINHRL